MSNKILCVRESESLIGKISSYLAQENITVDNEEKAENCMRQLEEGIYSLITINSSSCSDWISSTVEIRKRSNIPIVIFSNEKNLLDEIAAIKIGADDKTIWDAFHTEQFGDDFLNPYGRKKESKQVSGNSNRFVIEETDLSLEGKNGLNVEII